MVLAAALELIDDAPANENKIGKINEEGLQQNARFLEGVLDDFVCGKS